MYGDWNGLNVTNEIIGPWECGECHQVSQYADVQSDINRIFCRNPSCRYERIIDKRKNVIRENDGTYWQFDSAGNKVRIRAL